MIIDPLTGDYPNLRAMLPGVPRPPRLDWVIVGGESGPSARPCNLSWIGGVVGLSQEAGTPVFVKQLGYRAFDSVAGIIGAGLEPEAGMPPLRRLQDRKGGDPSEWPADLDVRQWPQAVSA